jgi:hypothetical protein
MRRKLPRLNPMQQFSAQMICRNLAESVRAGSVYSLLDSNWTGSTNSLLSPEHGVYFEVVATPDTKHRC